MLSNGEKCNPGPIGKSKHIYSLAFTGETELEKSEAEIAKSPHVRASVVFGRERNQTGVLIEIKESIKERYYEPHGREKLVEEIM